MTSKTIDNIVWWIPFRKLRDKVRDYLNFRSDNINGMKDFLNFQVQIRDYLYLSHIPCYDIEFIIDFRKSFKEDTDFLSKYMNLIKNLDYDSRKIINKIIARITRYNNIEDGFYFSYNELRELNNFFEEFNNKIIKVNEELFIYDKYVLPFNQFEPEVFYDNCGINYIKNINQIKNKSIIDAGGFIGDSAIVLSDYTDKAVYSFEPLLQHCNMMLKTIELNKKSNIVPVNMALGDSNGEICLFSHGHIDSGFSINNANESDFNRIENKVKMTTLDSYVKENNIEVGLIKTDLEGFEQPFLKGAINTIKEQKPVLIISIYHNYSDFFEIKPMIENLNLGYKFKIIKNRVPKAIVETRLLAEV